MVLVSAYYTSLDMLLLLVCNFHRSAPHLGETEKWVSRPVKPCVPTFEESLPTETSPLMYIGMG